MRPFAVINAIIFGSATAIAFGLVGVLVIFLVLQGKYPEMSSEFSALARSGALFTILAVVSGASLLATLKGRPWRRYAQLIMWVLLAAVAGFYWPR